MAEVCRGAWLCAKKPRIVLTLTVESSPVLGKKIKGKDSFWSQQNLNQKTPLLEERKDVQPGALSGAGRSTLLAIKNLILLDKRTEGVHSKRRESLPRNIC